jgi:hypothetical protein
MKKASHIFSGSVRELSEFISAHVGVELCLSVYLELIDRVLVTWSWMP